MSIKANYPDIRPTLNLDFANTKRLDPRITFTRTTTGTYVGSDGLIKTAAIDEARFDHDPATGESLGLLAEESRTNLIPYSEEFDNAAWIKIRSTTVTASSVTTPDGETNGYLLESSGADRIEDTLSTAITGTATLSIFAKYNNVSYISMTILDASPSGQRQWFKIDDGTLGSSTAVGAGKNLSDASITDMGNGFYRLSMSVDGFSSQTARCLIYLARTDSSFDASSGDAAIIYGAQLEQGSFPTSYIPTSGSTVTRSADVASIATSAFGFNRPQGTLFAQYQLIGLDGTTPVVYGDNANGRFIYHVTGSIRAFDGTTIEAVSTNVQSDTQANKVAMFFDESEFGLSVLGSAIEKSNYDGTGFDDASELDLTSGGNYHMKKLQYYPLRLSNTVLQGLTS